MSALTLLTLAHGLVLAPTLRQPAAACAAAPRLRSTASTSIVCMAGFGGGGGGGGKKAAAKKKEPVSARKQWSSFTALRKEGAASVRVYARDGSLEADDWLEVGEVAVGSSDTVEAALQFQKRLILEHAARLSPKLAIVQKKLTMGFEADGETKEHTKPAEVGESVTCGFLGAPDPGGFYAKGNRNEKSMAAKGAAPPADSKGRLSK